MTSSKRALVLGIVTLCLVGCERPEPDIDAPSVERVITTLSGDEMLGRAPFTPGIDKAADFIRDEFASIGLEVLDDMDDYLQRFVVYRLQVQSRRVVLNGIEIPSERSAAWAGAPSVHWTTGDPVEGDSIANGANDGASGTTAVIELARYFKAKGEPERTLIFAAFTAEEIGFLGSEYLARQLDPTEVVAMFSIAAIGKVDPRGPNRAHITGFDRSDVGAILQRAVEGTPYSFYPDPYVGQYLFRRSDNAPFARLGVPAHAIGTMSMDPREMRISTASRTKSRRSTSFT